MFKADVYRARRNALRKHVRHGLAIFVGHSDASMNYRDNPYPFVQDGCFSYFFGLQAPDLVGVVDLESGQDWLFGSDFDLEAVVWHGSVRTVTEMATAAGVDHAGTPRDLKSMLDAKRKERTPIRFAPAYRGRTQLALCELLDATPATVAGGSCAELISAIVALRECKGPEELSEMEAALDVARDMHVTAMGASRPGIHEREVVAEIERVVRRLDWQLAYPVIFSRSGEILHNHDHSQLLRAGDLVINDSGAASALGYASDITRTLPIGGRFEGRSRTLYEIVLQAQAVAIDSVKPGMRFIDVHKRSMQALVEGLMTFGVFNGRPADVVETGAYAVVCQGGLGHQIGLDVHDMEGLGEDFVGYDREVTRSKLFGLNRVRLGKRVKPGMTITIEPGLYFIPALIEAWRSERRHADFIDYDRLSDFIGAGGLRVEDEIVVTENACRILGKPIPKSIADVEAAMGR
jgi:Xaa-Pro aminopeptidase/Xaa-Pro dipeptidase